MTEKLITMARKGGLANRRLLIARLGNLDAATLLIDEIAPQIKRDSGYLRIERAGFRRGDNTEMATISFVDEINFEDAEEVEAPAKTTKSAEKAATKAKDAKPAEKEDK